MTDWESPDVPSFREPLCARCDHSIRWHRPRCTAMSETTVGDARVETVCDCEIEIPIPTDAKSLAWLVELDTFVQDLVGRIVERGYTSQLTLNEIGDAVDNILIQNVIEHAHAVHYRRRELDAAEDQLREALVEIQEAIWS